ncbi:glycosyl transferase [Thioclava sp.]|uniref:glycosyl transferase n=1 Tax=Thioclava sp. TaxID=1933450 RepID=UPI003AA85714
MKTLGLRVEGQGQFKLTVFQSDSEHSSRYIFKKIVHLAKDRPFQLDLSPFVLRGQLGVVHFALKSLGEGDVSDAVWETNDPPLRNPSLTLSITTFKRETAVQASVARFESFMKKTALASRFHLLVVDNGRSANIKPSAHVSPIDNDNLGGSGGFARGLYEAEARGATHCLFMDDDAAVHMGAMERVWAFLAHAQDESTAIVGSIAMANKRWALWESGAIFDSSCRPQWQGTDLRDFLKVLAMETGSTLPKPYNFYGGWWFFAFPIASAAHKPFPFFVRGDDVSFSLANRFNFVTLPGVICFQDADFSDKESLQTLYLDLRSHLIHHLALPSMDIGLKRTLRIPAWFFARSMMQLHYDSLKTLNLALEDVLRGPKFFATNADMTERRAVIAKLRKIETWAPLIGDPPVSKRRFDPRSNRFWHALMRYSLNGHLLPFFGFWGNHITLKSGQRGALHEVWGAARITYISADGSQSFTVRHSKRAALCQGLRMTKNEIALARRYRDLKAQWQKGYGDLTSWRFWLKKFGLDAPEGR